MVVMTVWAQLDPCNCNFSACFQNPNRKLSRHFHLGECLVTVFSHDGICTVINNGTET